MMQLSIAETGIYLAGNLIRMYIISCLFGVFFKREAPPRRKCIRAAAYTGYYIVNSIGFLYLGFSPNINLIVNFAGAFAVALTYSGRIPYKIFAAIANIVLNVICEDLSLSIVLHFKIEEIFIVAIIASDMIAYMITLIIQRAVSFRRGIKVTVQEWLAVILIPLLTLFISIIVLGMKDNTMAVAMGEVVLILINILVFFLMDRTQKMYLAKLEISMLEQQKEAYENQMMLSRQSEEHISAMRHDMKNHIIAVRELARESGCESVEKYMESLSSELEQTKYAVSTGNGFMDSFLNLKLNKAMKTGAAVTTDIIVSNRIFIEPEDICTILGNLLDNAIEAIEKCSEMQPFVNVEIKQNPGNIFIRIDNTFNRGIKIRKRGDRFLSTKRNGEHHGFGIENVRKTVEKYGGNIEIEMQKDIFSVKIILFEKQ